MTTEIDNPYQGEDQSGLYKRPDYKTFYPKPGSQKHPELFGGKPEEGSNVKRAVGLGIGAAAIGIEIAGLVKNNALMISAGGIVFGVSMALLQDNRPEEAENSPQDQSTELLSQSTQ